jgi:predicted MPP superfamily phosphohydrolase
MGKREQKILKILDDLQPDIIFLTGDYVLTIKLQSTFWNKDMGTFLTN